MENNNNNGRGIFYGVIGVATLVVAIIGATFAYFAASVTSNNIVNVGSTKVELQIVDEVNNFRMDMIPVETETNITLDSNNDGTADMTAFATFPGLTADADATGAGTCRDLVGNSICSVYQFTVKNPNPTTAQTVVGSLKISTNGFTNLYYAVFKGKAAGITHYDVNADATATVVTSGTTQTPAATGSVIVGRTKLGAAGTEYTETNSEWSNTSERLDANGGETSYTVVIWLEETGSKQDEMEQTFAAGVTFTSDTGAGVTGILTTGN